MSIKFENVVLPSAEQWRAIILGARNPFNSWEKSDSHYCNEYYGCEKTRECDSLPSCYEIGPNDLDLMGRLAAGGPVHAKYRRMIAVIVTITAPLYWWKEFDTYKVGTVVNSCSTMHEIADKEFTLEGFSTEHLFDRYGDPSMNLNYGGKHPIDMMNDLIRTLNHFRHWYLETKDKRYWWQMIQLLPSSYNQKRTVMMNYEVLANIYKSRRNHKLDEWAEHTESTCPVNKNTICSNPKEFLLCEDCSVGKGFCDWIKTLPYSELITGKE